MSELSTLAQHWVNVVLIWIGLGSLAGLLARIVLPLGEPGALGTLTLGMTGSAVGLGVLSWIIGDRPFNPVSPLGFLAAAGGAFGLLLLYSALQALVRRSRKDPRS